MPRQEIPGQSQPLSQSGILGGGKNSRDVFIDLDGTIEITF